MKKLLWVIIVIIIIVIVGIGFWRLLGRHSAVTEKTSGASQQQAPEVFEQIDLDRAVRGIKDEYKSDPSFNQCLANMLDSCLGSVIPQKVAETHDSRYCDDYITEQAQKSCRLSATLQQAREKKDINICDQLNDAQKDACRTEVVVAQALEKEQVDACDTLGDTQKDACRTQVAHQLAIKKNDASWCDKIPARVGPDGTSETIDQDMCKQDVQIEHDIQTPPPQPVVEPQQAPAPQEKQEQETPTPEQG